MRPEFGSLCCSFPWMQAVLMNMRLLVFAKTEYCDGTISWQDGPLIHSVQHTHSATGLLAGTVTTLADLQLVWQETCLGAAYCRSRSGSDNIPRLETRGALSSRFILDRLACAL